MLVCFVTTWPTVQSVKSKSQFIRWTCVAQDGTRLAEVRTRMATVIAWRLSPSPTPTISALCNRYKCAHPNEATTRPQSPKLPLCSRCLRARLRRRSGAAAHTSDISRSTRRQSLAPIPHLRRTSVASRSSSSL